MPLRRAAASTLRTARVGAALSAPVVASPSGTRPFLSFRPPLRPRPRAGAAAADEGDMGNQAVSGLKEDPPAPTVVKSPAEWRAALSPLAYDVTREGGTERAGTGEFTAHRARGTYSCVCCGTALFTHEEKFDSHCGWPAFWAPMGGAAAVQGGPIRYLHDGTGGMVRTEVRCRACEAHLGHVFNDGPAEKGGLRYCINSVCLTFKSGAVAPGGAAGGAAGGKGPE
jgi:peptide-methionine (R)-S-oxide reductase